MKTSTASRARGTVVVTAPGFDADGARTGARLRRHGFAVHHAGPRAGRSPDEVAALVSQAVAVIASADPFTRSVFAAASDLRVVARLGVGVDSIDLEAAERAGVVVTVTPGLNDETCADHTLALLLAVTRRVVEHDASVRRGDWERGGRLTPWDLHGKCVGVVGYGRIGQAVVRRLRGFGTAVKVFDPVLAAGTEFGCDSLAELLACVDVLTLHLPLTAATAGLIAGPELAAMKPGAILVNTSRGGILDEAAVLDALESGRLRAAGIDVFLDEPPSHPVWRSLPNVVLSPHVGGLSVEAIDAMAGQCVQQIIDVFAGRSPAGVVGTSLAAGPAGSAGDG